MPDYQKLYTFMVNGVSERIDDWPDLGPLGEMVRDGFIYLLQCAEDQYLNQE